MSRRKTKRCQRRYNHGVGKSKMCGRLISRMRNSIYCPECEAKMASMESRNRIRGVSMAQLMGKTMKEDGYIWICRHCKTGLDKKKVIIGDYKDCPECGETGDFIRGYWQTVPEETDECVSDR